MDINVKRFVVGGRQKPVVDIVGQDLCLYCPLVSLYLTLKEECSHNTVMRMAYELRFFLGWLAVKNVNILQRIKTGKFLTDLEVASFCADTKHRVGYEQYQVIPARPTDKYLSNVMHQMTCQAATVSAGVTNGRLIRAEDYLKFLHRELNRHALLDHYDNNFNRNQVLLNDGHRRELTHGQKGLEHVAGKTISNETMDRMFSLLLVENPGNPFTQLVRTRNKIIVDLLVDTGVRRGALAKLKISNIYFEGGIQKILITRSRLDAADPRANKPEQKTQEHFVYPSPETMENLKKYIEKFRPLVSGYERHEFVFVTEKNSRGTRGMPISLDAINNIFEILSKLLKVKLHPHLLRHYWNERFSDLAKEKGLTSVEVDKYRKLLMGWTPTSEMPARYNKIRDIERSQGIARAMQREMLKGDSNEKII